MPGRWSRRLQQAAREEGGAATIQAAILLPALLLLLFGVVQGALWLHGRNVAIAAAQEGVAAARVDGGGTTAGTKRAKDFVTRAGGTDVLRDVQVTTTRNGNTMRVTVQGKTASIVPGVPIRVSQSAEGPVERFTGRSQP